MSGKVYLVGAGPGDPGLLTLKGARVLAKAQAVVYDYLANPEFLDLAPAEAERIYVGKRGGDHTKTQKQINRLLCDLAGSGKTVVRLKGGDPFVFGRGSEEASALAAEGHAFEVIPGVTSAIAGPAYAGIPVTDRRFSTEVAFVTGHEDPTKPGSTIDWPSLSGLGTVVFLMGMKNLPHICGQLIKHGKAPDTPAACVRWGATPRQASVVSTLAELPPAAEAAGLKHPAVIIVGGVVSLRETLSWYERLPLFGRRILVTRARKQASRLSAALRELGAMVVETPTIDIAPPSDPGPLLASVAGIAQYDWLLFTSVNGVEGFFEALAKAGKDVRALSGLKLGAIGPATAQALGERGLIPDVVAKSFVAEGLLEALGEHEIRDKRVLLPRAEQAREVLPETLREWGAVVDVVPAYETVPPAGARELLAQALDEGLDVLSFTASSTVKNFMALLDDAAQARVREQSQAGELLVASIGPITTQACQDLGLEVHITPDAYTIDALVAALTKHFAAS